MRFLTEPVQNSFVLFSSTFYGSINSKINWCTNSLNTLVQWSSCNSQLQPKVSFSGGTAIIIRFYVLDIEAGKGTSLICELATYAVPACF